MRPFHPYLFIFCFVASCVKQDAYVDPAYYNCSLSFNDSSARHTHHAQRKALLDGLTASGLPGIQLAVREPSGGLWMGTSGFADLNSRTPVENCSITRVGSTVKTFTAVTILQLWEAGKLDLDDPVRLYLPAATLHDIENASQATVRELLQHASGIYNYIQNPAFQTASLNNLIKEWQPDELLAYARRKKSYFRPGTDVRYSNTNYILLGLIIEKICGKPFYEVFEEQIFRSLHLTKTRFAATTKVPDGIVRGYVDMHSQLKVTDATYFSGWDYFTADGGLISNPVDLTLFMQTLFEGKLLSPRALQEILRFKTPKTRNTESFPMHYGLGIFKTETPYGDAYTHSGDAIGYYATMMYFPEKHIVISWAVNGNYGRLDDLSASPKAISHILGILLQ